MSNKTFGIDISLYQNGIDLKKAYAEGARFAIIKCGEGGFKDPQFNTHYKNANAAGLHVGAYFFGHAKNTSEAATEAKYCASILKGKALDFPVFYDVESPSMDVGKTLLTEIVKTFCSTLESLGYWAGFYTNLNWYTYKLNGVELAKRFSMWLAYWGSAKPQINGVQMWQFGGETNLLRSNKIAGVVCDQDYAYVDFPTLIKKKGLNNTKKTTLKVDDRVRVKKNSPVWESSVLFSPWVYNITFYVREICGNRVVFSTGKTGPVTGAIDKKYLYKV